MHNQIIEKRVKYVGQPARVIAPVQKESSVKPADPVRTVANQVRDICVKPFKLSKFTSRKEAKPSPSKPVKLKLWGNAE